MFSEKYGVSLGLPLPPSPSSFSSDSPSINSEIPDFCLQQTRLLSSGIWQHVFVSEIPRIFFQYHTFTLFTPLADQNLTCCVSLCIIYVLCIRCDIFSTFSLYIQTNLHLLIKPTSFGINSSRYCHQVLHPVSPTGTYAQYHFQVLLQRTRAPNAALFTFCKYYQILSIGNLHGTVTITINC